MRTVLELAEPHPRRMQRQACHSGRLMHQTCTLMADQDKGAVKNLL